MDIEAYKFKVKSKHKSKAKAKSSQTVQVSDVLKAAQEEQDYRNAILLQREENYDATVRLHQEMERAIEAQRQTQKQEAEDEIRRAKIRDTIRNTHKTRVLKSRRTRSIR
jgi:ribulose-5-phosphate 4-epimerase/fuculose-1-phosphate aldolase